MPRVTEGRTKQAETRRPPIQPAPLTLELSPGLVESLRPWIDLEQVGSDGFQVWLSSVLPLIPLPRTESSLLSVNPAARIKELAAALSGCASDRARVHFQAAEYYRDNQRLARRLRALESVLRTSSSPSGAVANPGPDSEADAAAERYLPPRKC